MCWKFLSNDIPTRLFVVGFGLGACHSAQFYDGSRCKDCDPHCQEGSCPDLAGCLRCKEGYHMAFGHCIPQCEDMSAPPHTMCAPSCELNGEYKCKSPSSTCYHPSEGQKAGEKECRCRDGMEPFHGLCATKCEDGMVRTLSGSCMCPEGTKNSFGRCMKPCPPSQIRQPDGECGCQSNQVRTILY